MSTSASDEKETGGWKFSQCFGEKGNLDEVTEGYFLLFSSFFLFLKLGEIPP